MFNTTLFFPQFNICPACNCYQFPFLANFFQEEDNTVNSKGVKVRPARPGVKPANKQLRTSVGDKVNMFTLPLLIVAHCVQFQLQSSFYKYSQESVYSEFHFSYSLS